MAATLVALMQGAVPLDWAMRILVALCVTAVGFCAVTAARRVFDEADNERGELLLLLPDEPLTVADTTRGACSKVLNWLGFGIVAMLLVSSLRLIAGFGPAPSISTPLLAAFAAVGVARNVAGAAARRTDFLVAAGAGAAAGVAVLAFGWGLTWSARTNLRFSTTSGFAAQYFGGMVLPAAACAATVWLIPRADQPLPRFLSQLIRGEGWLTKQRRIFGVGDASEALPLGSRTGTR